MNQSYNKRALSKALLSAGNQHSDKRIAKWASKSKTRYTPDWNDPKWQEAAAIVDCLSQDGLASIPDAYYDVCVEALWRYGVKS